MPFVGMRPTIYGLILRSFCMRMLTIAGVRRELIKSQGFCQQHARVLLEFKNKTGTAIIYQDQIRIFLQALKGVNDLVPQAFGKRPSLKQHWEKHEVCPACRRQEDIREAFLRVFSDWISDEEQLRGEFLKSAGLCAPHFWILLDNVTDGTTRLFLKDFQAEKFQALLAELEELCRKHDYRFNDGQFGPEYDSWQRVVDMMPGKPEVFPD